MTTLRVMKCTSSVEPEESKRRMIGISTGCRFPGWLMMESNTFSAARLHAWTRSRLPLVIPCSVVTHSSSHCLAIATSCGNSHGRCAPPSAAKNCSRSISVLAIAKAMR